MGRMFDRAWDQIDQPHLMDLMAQYPDFVDEVQEALLAGGSPTGKKLAEAHPDGPRVFTAKFLKTNSFCLDTSGLLENYEQTPTLEGAKVFVASNVAKYYLEHATEVNLAEFLPTYAPPFEKFWIEYNTGMDLPAIAGFSEVGILVNGYDHTDAPWNTAEIKEKDPDNWRWSLELFIYLTKPNGHVAGPYFCWRIFVSADGRPFKESLDMPKCPGFGDFEDDAWDAVRVTLNLQAAQLVRPALLTLGFLHCKNVEQVKHVPPKSSRKQRRRDGSSKSSYYSLDIEPMRKVLKSDGNVERTGLANALHFCRGHFKNFTPEAPLMGKAVGAFWWTSHVRGLREKGEIFKDYRIQPPRTGTPGAMASGVGAEWIELSESTDISSPKSFSDRNSDASTRGLNAHSRILNLLAGHLRQMSISPRRPLPHEPQFDLAWETETEVWVVEAKSTTPSNEEDQLRKALGQVLVYRWHLQQEHTDKIVRPLILIETELNEKKWLAILATNKVIIIWPELLTPGFLPK